MKKALIIGVSGFIGKELYHSLSNVYHVYGVSRSKVDLPNCSVVDVINKEQLEAYFSQKEFDVVINLAAVLASAENLTDIGVLVDNLQITRNLIEVLKTKTNTHFVNFSSSSVYSNMSGAYKEEDLIRPSHNSDCIYGLSKFNSETLFDFILSKEEISVTQLRVPMVYGDRMDRSRIHKMFEKELAQQNTISVWGNGERVISHIHIDELTSKIKAILEQRILGIYNVMGESLSTEELAIRIIKEKGNSASKVVKVDRGSKAKFVLDGSNLNQLLNA